MSESPEEESNTGVLGRIGSWFSPWKGKGPRSPTENACPASDQTLKSEKSEESDESVRPQAGQQQREEEEEESQSSNPNPLGFSRDIFLCEGEDATQSAHRHSSAASSTETGIGGPKEEEFVENRKKRIGQGKKEGSSNGTSVSGNLEKNASHLTHLSSQGVVWDSDQGHTQPRAQRKTQAQTGKRLHVYLEETSVIQCGQNTCAGQEVVRTKITKSLQVLPKAKSSPSSDSSKISVSDSAENKRTNVRPGGGAQSYYSALAGLPLKSQKDSQLRSEPDKEQTAADSMGRKNAAKRKHRKNSQGDGGSSPKEKMPPSPQPAPEGSPSSDNPVTSPQVKSPKTQVGESPINSSSSRHNSTSQASPEGGESKTLCPDTVEELDNFQDSKSVTSATPVCVGDEGADMEDDDSFYKVERKTETPESKRLSMKISRSEVKLFPKNVPLNPKQSKAADSRSVLKFTKDEENTKGEADPRLHELKKSEEHKSNVGQIADKISLFEQQQVMGSHKQTCQTPRSADVSPIGKATERPKADIMLSDQRSRSAECYGTARSTSSSPVREKLVSIKERAVNFTEASISAAKPAKPPKPALMAKPPKPALMAKPQKSTSSLSVAVSESTKLDSQGELDTKVQTKAAAMLEITSKPDGQDVSAVGVKMSVLKEQPTDSNTTNAEASETADQDSKSKSVESDDPVKETGDSSEVASNIGPQPKGPSRIGSRSKKRKSKEPTSPLSPNSENPLTSKPEITAFKQEQVVTTQKVSLTSDKSPKITSDKHSLSDTEQKTFPKELDTSDKQNKQPDPSFKKDNIDKPVSRQGASPINKDEPDTAAPNSGTKMSIDKGPVMLPKEEEEAGGHSLVLSQERDRASKESTETSASPLSPAVEPTEKPPSVQQASSVKNPKLQKALPMQPESKSKEKVRQPSKADTGETLQPQNKDTEPINPAENKDVEKLVKVTSEKTNQTEKKIEETQQLLCLHKNTTQGNDSDSGQCISGPEERVTHYDERKNVETKDDTEPIKDTTKPIAGQPEPAPQLSKNSGSSDLSAKTQHVVQTAATHPETATTNVITQTNEAVSKAENERKLLKAKTATNVPVEVKTKSRESTGAETVPAVTAAEPQSKSASVEKMENSPDDSCTHGANDAELSGSQPKTSPTAAVKEVAVKAANDTPVLVTPQPDNMAERELSVKQPTPVSLSKPVNRKQAGQDGGNKSSSVKSVPSGDRTEDVIKLTSSHPPHEESKQTRTSDSTSLKGTGESPTDSSASKPTVKAEKTLSVAVKELPPVANGDISLHTQLLTTKKEAVSGKPSPTPTAPTFPEPGKLNPDSVQRPSMKKLHLPRGLIKDDSAKQQDAPSSWLDVDFPKRKRKFSAPKLSSSGSESNLLDASGELDDDDFIEKIKNLCAPFSLPPRKHNPIRPPQPPFAMPAIKEDHFEKTFDPEEFKFGLRKKKFTLDTGPSLLANLQNAENKSGLKPARASLADRSMLLSGRLRDKTLVKGEEDVKEEKDDTIKVKSRLEGSCVLSSLTSSFRGKRNGAQAEGTSSGDVSPSETPQLTPPPLPQPAHPSLTATAPVKDMLANKSPSLSDREEAQTVEAVVTDSGPPLPSFNDIKLPDYLEKYLPREAAKPVQSIQGQDQAIKEVTGKMTTLVPGGESELTVKPGPLLPNAVPPCFPGIPATTHPTLPELKQPAAQPQGRVSKAIRAVKGFHKRPGKMVLFEKSQFSGQAHEIYRDVADATSLHLSPLISVKVVRGCWILYEKPDFQGRCIALEEGGIELTNVWAEPGLETEADNTPPMLIGSIRLAVCDYTIPHIDLFTEPEGHGRITPYHDDTIETCSFGIPLNTASIQVHSGVWLVFSDPGFQGMLAVLEKGVYPFPETWGFPSPFVGSLRPLKMGGFKVENPSEVKAVVYEEPCFEGSCLEIDNDIFSFGEDEAPDGANGDSKKLKSVGSLKIIRGFWVGYSEPGFEGQQHILEEGEYLDCGAWGGSGQLLSLRPILADFMTPHLKMFNDRNFGKLGVNIDLTVPVINMDDTGYGMKTQSIDIISGVWVVFEEPGFCGESYILEKGLYGSPEDWGALQPRVAAAMPILLDDFENAAKFKVQLFSDTGFQGSVLTLDDNVASLPQGFSVASCRVLAGNWLAFEGQDFAGRMYVLDAGSYPDLRAMGCINASSSILSLQTVGFEFSLPSITLFERCGLRGKRVVLSDGSVNLQLAGGCSRIQSVLVEGGMWVLYEGINYRGAQILLQPGDIPDWHKFSSWQKIGSLRPLIQKQVHFRLRNRQSGLMMSVTGSLEDVKLLRIQETEEIDRLEQIWFYKNGHLHCKLLEECCLSPSGTVMMAGSRVSLTPEPGIHLWSITPEGFIRYTPTSDLVLEVKGGHHYDKNQVILNSLDPNKLQQRWNVEII